MDFFKRLLTRKTTKKKQSEENPRTSAAHTSHSTNELLLTANPTQDQQAVNRLLRSSSARFSILSETEYRSLPPIPHPINTLLREPSIISTQTTNSVNTYTVTVHTRTVHSRTEFPNANGTTSLLSTPSNTPRETHSLPPLTPGDNTRLENLRQDPSVLSLLDIFDESGHPDPQAFANTPAPRQRKVSTFKMLLGEHDTVGENSSENVKESDLSWAEHVLEGARRGSTSASSLHSSLGMDDDLFKDHLSHIDDFNESMTSQSSEIPDSLEVELGTAEDGSMLVHPLKSVRSEESLLRFLSKGGKQINVNDEAPSLQSTPSKPKLSTALQTVPQAPRGPRGMGEPESTPLPRLTMRSGPQQQTQLSPPPRKQQPQPLPPIPHDFQFKPSRPAKTLPLGYRAPFSSLPNNTMRGSAIPSETTDRSVSIASSICPQIETIHQLPLPPLPALPEAITPPNYDPFAHAPRRLLGGRREPKNVSMPINENLPPGAPLRPTKSEVRKFLKGAKQSDKSRSTKSPKKAQQTLLQADNSVGPDDAIDAGTPRKSLIAKFQTPERPSPTSSSELSPEGRRIMATVRAQAHTQGRTPRKWNPLADSINTLTTALS